MKRTCTECGADISNATSCNDLFDQMLAWDFADFAGAGRYHHLTVLCYYLQHPKKYSPRGLHEAKKFLEEIVKKTLSVDDLYRRESEIFSSSERDWSVRGNAKEFGSYGRDIHWQMTAADVVADGVENYPKNVLAWAESIWKQIQ